MRLLLVLGLPARTSATVTNLTAAALAAGASVPIGGPRVEPEGVERLRLVAGEAALRRRRRRLLLDRDGGGNAARDSTV